MNTVARGCRAALRMHYNVVAQAGDVKYQARRAVARPTEANLRFLATAKELLASSRVGLRQHLDSCSDCKAAGA